MAMGLSYPQSYLLPGSGFLYILTGFGYGLPAFAKGLKFESLNVESNGFFPPPLPCISIYNYF